VKDIMSGENLRRFPRKEYQRKVGMLFAGSYIVVDAIEISEGGISFMSEFTFTTNRECVLTLQIPKGDFISIRAVIKHMTKMGSHMSVGVSFVDLAFSNKRQIRNFVADRERGKISDAN
jgi:c-di-GMP-binding flagellar brake protein YcgR